MSDPLASAEITITHRLVDASNATLLGDIEGFGKVIYKPVAGERPLWDFPTGTLAHREVATYLLSEFLQLHAVPRTILRDGPYGPGMVQQWIEIDPEVDLISFGQSEDPQLRLLALFDAIINNTDRKFGHLLIDHNRKLLGCDHGVTFHHEDKLRTVIWQFSGVEFSPKELEMLNTLVREQGELKSILGEHLSDLEIGALFGRVDHLLSSGRFPYPSDSWPAVPWPPV